ncbi:MAG: outer rane lipoprotein carrier protein LolA [Flavipsychrobacter sp.]|nr:outer rane lipoprotein carrier protein LolA [Flavipsychrobacter sp.]
MKCSISVRMRNVFIIVCCILSLNGFGQYQGYKPLANTEEFKRQFTKAAQGTQSIQCDFTQDKNLSMMDDKIVSTGKFWFKRENKVRMEYQKPTYYLLVINGNDVKTKDGQKENKVSAKSNKVFEQVNKMMIDCVQGTALDNKSFTTRIYEGNQSYLIEMTPVVKNLQGIFKNINLTVDKKDHSVVKIDMIEQSGDNTVISFQHKQVNVNIPDALFSVK